MQSTSPRNQGDDFAQAKRATTPTMLQSTSPRNQGDDGRPHTSHRMPACCNPRPPAIRGTTMPTLAVLRMALVAIHVPPQSGGRPALQVVRRANACCNPRPPAIRGTTALRLVALQRLQVAIHVPPQSGGRRSRSCQPGFGVVLQSTSPRNQGDDMPAGRGRRRRQIVAIHVPPQSGGRRPFACRGPS